jgi:hypothetical protein
MFRERADSPLFKFGESCANYLFCIATGLPFKPPTSFNQQTSLLTRESLANLNGTGSLFVNSFLSNKSEGMPALKETQIKTECFYVLEQMIDNISSFSEEGRIGLFTNILDLMHNQTFILQLIKSTSIKNKFVLILHGRAYKITQPAEYYQITEILLQICLFYFNASSNSPIFNKDEVDRSSRHKRSKSAKETQKPKSQEKLWFLKQILQGGLINQWNFLNNLTSILKIDTEKSCMKQNKSEEPSDNRDIFNSYIELCNIIEDYSIKVQHNSLDHSLWKEFISLMIKLTICLHLKGFMYLHHPSLIIFHNKPIEYNHFRKGGILYD